jgi:group I intron endonuclease
MDVKYKNFKIYKISHKESNNCYIGSTCNFSSRKSHHRKNTTNKVGKTYWCKLYRFIRDNGGWVNFNIDIIESYPCNTREAGKLREQYFIDLIIPLLNTNNSYKFLGNIPSP